mgnify:CR=1 FL=1
MLATTNSTEMPLNIITNIETFDDPSYWMGYRIIMSDELGNLIDGDQIIAAIATRWKNKKMLRGGVIGTLMSNFGIEKFFKNKKFKDQMLRNIPLGRVAQESDVATAVAFLAADSSEMITGTSLVVDGGWTAQ